MNFKEFIESFSGSQFELVIGRAVNQVHKADPEDIFDASDSIHVNYTKAFFNDFKEAIKAFHDAIFATKKEIEDKTEKIAISPEDKTIVQKNHTSNGIVHVSLTYDSFGKPNDIAWWNKSSHKVFFGNYLKDKPKLRAWLTMPSIYVPNSMDAYAKWKQNWKNDAEAKTIRK